MYDGEENLYEVESDKDYKICLADLLHQARKICLQKGIGCDPYNVGVTADYSGNVLIYLISENKNEPI
jgi:hypothetical protein